MHNHHLLLPRLLAVVLAASWLVHSQSSEYGGDMLLKEGALLFCIESMLLLPARPVPAAWQLPLLHFARAATSSPSAC